MSKGSVEALQAAAREAVKAYEDLEKKEYANCKNDIVCPVSQCNSKGNFVNKGISGNLDSRGVRRLQLKCKECDKCTYFRVILDQMESMKEVKERLEGELKKVPLTKEIKDNFKTTKINDSEREKLTFSEVSQSKDEEPTHQGMATPMNRSLKRKAETSMTKISTPHRAAKSTLTPGRLVKEALDFIGIDTESEELVKMRVEKKDLADQLQKALLVIEELKKDNKRLEQEVVQLNGSISEMQGKKETAPSATSKEKEVRAEPTKTECKEDTVLPEASVANETDDLSHKKRYVDLFIPSKDYSKKEIKELKRMVTPFKQNAEMAKQHHQFRWIARNIENPKQARIQAWKMIDAAGLKPYVKDISTVGGGILELYMEKKDWNTVREGMLRWAERDTFIHEKDVGLIKGKFDHTVVEKKMMTRLTIMCARHPAKNWTTCILSNITDDGKRAHILEKAQFIRSEWAEKRSEPKKEESGNDEQ